MHVWLEFVDTIRAIRANCPTTTIIHEEPSTRVSNGVSQIIEIFLLICTVYPLLLNYYPSNEVDE